MTEQRQTAQPTQVTTTPDSRILQRQCACGQHTVAGGECESCRQKRTGILQRAAISSPPVGAVPPIVHDVLRSSGQPLDAGTRAFMEPRFGRDFSRIPTSTPSAGVLQTKLVINTPGDAYEQEADRIADQVVAAPTHTEVSDASPQIQRATISAAAPSSIQREATESCSVADEPKEESEEDEETEDLDPTETTISPKRQAGAPTPPEDIEARIDASRGNGAPLPHGTRDFMDSRFGYDFSSVRVHTGTVSERLNRDVHSLAFTTGNDIYFGSGQFRPDTEVGRHLLAHELTHVVQQVGRQDGSGMVHEKATLGTITRTSDVERKSYYKHRVSGEFVHHVLERILRGVDKELVTEAAIPGADRFGPALNKIGVADLYKSEPARTVTGVKGQLSLETEANVISMNDPDKVGTEPGVDSAPVRPLNVKGQKGIRERDWIGDFPKSISLGEIKPADAEMAGAGIDQLNSYEQGYKAFVNRIHTLSRGKTRGSLKVTHLSVTLPDRLNFDMWPTQHQTPSKDTTFKDRRLWVAYIGQGVYLYKDLARGLKGPPPEKFSNDVRKMRELKVPMNASHARTGKLMDRKVLPGGPGVGIARVAANTRSVRGIQRTTKDRPANYWSDRAHSWETERAAWGTEFRKALKTKYKDYREKVRFEKQLGKTSRKASAEEKREVKEYKSLMFWSGRAGKFLGKVRFLLGGAWDKVLGVFEHMKEKMGGIRTKVMAVAEGSIVGGWAKRLIQVIVGAAKIAVGAFITESFNFFADCFHSAMDKVVEKFQADLNEKFAEELCKARKLFEDSKERLEMEWGGAIKQLEELLSAIQNTKRWMDIASTLISLIRVGVQVVSCLTPPALGCLWGLVAQIGIGAAINLLVGTQWFNENIVTPTVRDLVRKYGSPHYQQLINRALGDNLKEYHCHIADGAFPALNFEMTGGLTTGTAALRGHRDAWEAENEAAILGDLQSVFEKGKGKKVTKGELQVLSKRLQESKLSPEELKLILENARNPLSGKLKIEKAAANVEKGEVPEAEPKERKINYEKAMQSNAKFQKIFSWNPLTFYKKPEIAADSEEFTEAVYDLQEALRIKADGILGEDTLIAFYDRNKLKEDLAYREASKMRGEKQAAKEKATADAGATGEQSRLASLPDAQVLAALDKTDWKKVVEPGVFIVDVSQAQPLLLGKLPDGERLGAIIQITTEIIQGKRTYRIIDASDMLLLDRSDLSAIEIPTMSESGKLVGQTFAFGPLSRGDHIMSADQLRGTTMPAR